MCYSTHWRPWYVQESKVGEAKIIWGGGKGGWRGYENRQREVWKHPDPAFLDMPDTVQVLGTEQWAKQTMPLLLYEEPNTHSPEDSKCSRGMKIACWVPSADERKNNCRPRWWWIQNKAKRTEKVGEHFIGNMSLQLGTEVYVAPQRPRHGDWKFRASLSLRYIELRPAWLRVTYLAVRL